MKFLVQILCYLLTFAWNYILISPEVHLVFQVTSLSDGP